MNTFEAARHRWMGPLRVAGLLLAELLVIHYARHAYNFECHTEKYSFCGVARNALLASYSLAAVFVILGLFARDTWRNLLFEADISARPLVFNLAGLAVLLVSLSFLRSDLTIIAQTTIYLVWAASAGMAIAGAMLMIAPLTRWRGFIAELSWRLPLVLLAGLAAPFIAIQIRPLWKLEFLSDQTFQLVTLILGVWGQNLEPHEGDKVIGADGFFINVAPSCSGIEGLVLTTAFSLIYLVLFRKELRFPMALLILPLALLASWLLNGLRIAVLVQLGISGYPHLAVGGFHSHAGWLMFTLLSLGIVLVTQSTGLFRGRAKAVTLAVDSSKIGVAHKPPLLEDWVTARILPFAVFMLSALVASTFSAEPDAAYPYRAAATAAVLFVFLRQYLAMDWQVSPAAICVGFLVGIMWIIVPYVNIGDDSAADAASNGPGWVWLFFRCVGTIVLVPILEELFFRDYLEGRLRKMAGPVWAAIATAILFAVLHNRWAEAFVAGLAFSWLARRNRNITDAIVAHAIANVLIFVVAVVSGDFSII